MTTTSNPTAYQPIPGSKDLGGLLEMAFLPHGKIDKLNAADYPDRALQGSSLIMSTPLGSAMSPLLPCLTVLYTSSCLKALDEKGDPEEKKMVAAVGVYCAGTNSLISPVLPIASALGGSGLISGIRPE